MRRQKSKIKFLSLSCSYSFEGDTACHFMVKGTDWGGTEGSEVEGGYL